MNAWVIGGYAIMLGTMLMNIFAMSRGVEVKEVSIIESMKQFVDDNMPKDEGNFK